MIDFIKATFIRIAFRRNRTRCCWTSTSSRIGMDADSASHGSFGRLERDVQADGCRHQLLSSPPKAMLYETRLRPPPTGFAAVSRTARAQGRTSTASSSFSATKRPSPFARGIEDVRRPLPCPSSSGWRVKLQKPLLCLQSMNWHLCCGCVAALSHRPYPPQKNGRLWFSVKILPFAVKLNHEHSNGCLTSAEGWSS